MGGVSMKMVKYYDKNLGELTRNLLNEVPSEILEKRNWIPYERITLSVYDDEEKPEDSWEILENKAILTTYNVIHRVTLEEARAVEKQNIKDTYNQLTQEGFVCSNGIKLDCRESDKINWLTVKLQGGVVEAIKDFDNQVHIDLEPSEVLTMMGELENYYKKLLNDKWVMEQTLDSLTTIDEIEQFYWRKPIMDEESMEVIDWEYNPILN